MDYTGRIITKNPQTPSANGAPGVWTLDEAMQYSKQGKWPPGYQISRSLRFRLSATAYLNRTPVAGNLTTWTWSGWVKRGNLANYQRVISTTSGASQFYFRFNSDNVFAAENAGTTFMVTTQVFRDPSAWYHIVFVWDTTNATAGDRARLYVNGSRITAFSTMTNPSSNATTSWNSATAHYICGAATSENLDCYLTEVNFIDGQALTPASFGYFDTYTGVWQPAPYTGTYGTNGFYLTFADNSAATAAAIGKDYSGNGNNWTPNNISVTAGTTYDSMVDVPINWGTDTGVGGEVRGNYATWNPLAKGSDVSTASGNLEASWSGVNGHCIMATMTLPQTGKWKCEITGVYQVNFGITPIATQKTTEGIGTTVGYGYRGTDGQKAVNGTYSAYGAAYGTTDIITLLYNADTLTLEFKKNNVSQGTISVASNIYVVGVGYQSPSAGTAKINFGQQSFAYTDSGYKALCTQNLPTPTISNGASYMAATLYTGTGGTLTISNGANNTIGTTFQPDWVWVKSRSAATDHKLTDSVRGATKALISDTTGAETTDTNGVTAFGTTGFTLGSDTIYNNSGATYVGWQWKASGSTVSNTNGSVTSTVSANTTAGFSIATFTPPASGVFTFGHGLGVAPNMVIFKDRNTSGNWAVYHSSIGPNSAVFLNTTGAISTSSGYFNNTSPTSTVATGNVGGVCTGSSPTVAYSFAAITDFSAFGSYTGNGSTDGPFIYLGFRPRFVLWKRTDSTGSWYIQDTSRNPYNQSTLSLYPNLADAETSGDDMDYLSNGFKVRDTFSYINASGGTYIYAAFAENPFTIARAR